MRLLYLAVARWKLQQQQRPHATNVQNGCGSNSNSGYSVQHFFYVHAKPNSLNGSNDAAPNVVQVLRKARSCCIRNELLLPLLLVAGCCCCCCLLAAMAISNMAAWAAKRSWTAIVAFIGILALFLYATQSRLLLLLLLFAAALFG